MFSQLVSKLFFSKSGVETAVSDTDKLPVEQDAGENEYIHVVTTITSAGNTTLYTPAIGKSIRIRKMQLINDPTAETPTLITVKLGSQEIWKNWVIATRQRKTGSMNSALVVNLTQPGNVAVTILLEEV